MFWQTTNKTTCQLRIFDIQTHKLSCLQGRAHKPLNKSICLQRRYYKQKTKVYVHGCSYKQTNKQPHYLSVETFLQTKKQMHHLYTEMFLQTNEQTHHLSTGTLLQTNKLTHHLSTGTCWAAGRSPGCLATPCGRGTTGPPPPSSPGALTGRWQTC